MILQWRFVNLAGKCDLVGTVGLSRIQVFGPSGKRRVQDIGCCIFGRIGIIPRTFLAPGNDNYTGKDDNEAESDLKQAISFHYFFVIRIFSCDGYKTL